MYCSNCGAYIQAGENFCSNCGARQPDQGMSVSYVQDSGYTGFSNEVPNSSFRKKRRRRKRMGLAPFITAAIIAVLSVFFAVRAGNPNAVSAGLITGLVIFVIGTVTQLLTGLGYPSSNLRSRDFRDNYNSSDCDYDCDSDGSGGGDCGGGGDGGG